MNHFRFSILLLTVLLAGCSNLPPLPSVNITWLSLQAARTAQEGMMDPAAQEPDRVYGAKIRIADKFYSLTTYAPLILASTGFGDERAISAVRFSRDQTEIQLFSRSPKNGEGFRVNIPLNEAADWPVFSFPFLRGNKLEMQPVQIVDLIRKPDQDDPVRGMREYLQRGMPELEPQFKEIE